MSGMDFLVFVQQLVVAMIAGGIIGTEREWSRHAAGLRTFTLVTVIGMVLTAMESAFQLTYLTIIGLAFVSLLSAELYWMKLEKSAHPGLTTSIVLVLAYILGILVGRGFYMEAVSASIVITFLLTAKHLLHHLVRNMKQAEIVEAMKFGIVSFVLFPILPDRTLDPWGLFNIRLIWLMAVLVLGIGFASYVAMRALGPSKGLGVTAILGGFISSTAFTYSMAEQVKKHPNVVRAASVGITLSNAVMLVKALIITWAIYQPLAVYILYPFLAASVVAISSTAFQLKELTGKVSHEIELESQLAFKPAIEFAVLFAIVTGLSIVGKELLGVGGIYLAAILGGVVQMNPVLVLMSTLAQSGGATVEIAGRGVIVAALVNTLMKAGIAYKVGGQKLGNDVFKSFALTTAAVLVVLVIEAL